MFQKLLRYLVITICSQDFWAEGRKRKIQYTLLSQNLVPICIRFLFRHITRSQKSHSYPGEKEESSIRGGWMSIENKINEIHIKNARSELEVRVCSNAFNPKISHKYAEC